MKPTENPSQARIGPLMVDVVGRLIFRVTSAMREVTEDRKAQR